MSGKEIKETPREFLGDQYHEKLLRNINTFMIIIAFISSSFFEIGSSAFYTTALFFFTMILFRIIRRFFSYQLYAFLFLYGSSFAIVGITFYSKASPNLSYLIFILITAGMLTNWKHASLLFLFDIILVIMLIGFGDFILIDNTGENPYLQIFPMIPFLILGFAFSLVISREIKLYFNKIISSENNLQTTLAGIIDGVITLNSENNIVYINQIALNLIGLEQNDINGRNLNEIITLIEENTNKVIDISKEIELSNPSLEIRRKNIILETLYGKRLSVDFTFTSLLDKNQVSSGSVFVFRDNTLQKQMEAIMIKNQQIDSIALLAGGIAHDFNNILGGMQGHVTLLEFDLKDQKLPETQQNFEGISHGIDKATRLTRQLLTFAKGGAPKKTICKISDIVKEAAEFSLHGTGIALEQHSPQDRWPINIDRDQISQVIQNLIINSSQANPKDKKIHILYENEYISENYLDLKKGPYVKIVFLDYGKGIPAENLSVIFNPYFTTKPNGTGLGLAVCHSIVSRHDGIILADSKENEYTKFTIYLPALPGEQIVAEYSSNQSKEYIFTKNNARILVLEDDELLHVSISKMLNRLNCESLILEDGKFVLEAYRKNKNMGNTFDLLLLDLTVPGGMGGIDTLKNLQKIDSKVLAIATSGYSTSNVAINYEDYGFTAFLSKPYSFSDLAKIINEVLKKKNEL